MAEIEPWMEKTVLLLRSKSEDSVEQLRTLLLDSIRQKYGNRKTLKPIPELLPSKKEESASKRKKTESKKISISARETISSDSVTSSSNDSEFALEILEEDLACVICREISIVPHNRLVECADCHSLYHQECHTPPIADSDVNDPRGVWYCNSCNKSVSKPKDSTSSSSSAQSNSSSTSSSSKTAPNKSSSTRNGQTFSNKPFGGLSVPGKKSSSSNSGSKSSSSSSSSKSVSPNMNIINADKRLQIMKKNAAKKQEKRISSK